jgi:hypothetical protein
MYKLGFYVPPAHLETVKSALFAAGAGRIGNYDSCVWQCLGFGQTGFVETVAEYRVELVCEDNLLHAVVAALINTHPYEEPAFDVVKLVDVNAFVGK